MERRKFLKTGTLATMTGITGIKLNPEGKSIPFSVPDPKYDSPDILRSYSAADHRKRLESIAFGERKVMKCARKHLITSYIPGHAVVGPDRPDWEPTEKVHKTFQDLKTIGIGIVQPWSSWATCWGKNYLVARNPDGFKRFVKSAQSYGLKVIPYTSSQFFERTDENFKKEWAWPKSFDLVELDYHLAHCSPASPEWRAYTIHRHLHVMDEYGVDGLYNDLGYVRPGGQEDFYRPENKRKYAEDDVPAFKEGRYQDGAMGDFLALLYAEVKRRGGIYKLHKEGVDTVYSDLNIYDYLWVGEATNDIDFVRESTKNYKPYVTPQRLINTSVENENESFINSIPYMQFPIIGHGQAGEQGERFIDTFKYWFDFYRPMTEEGSWVWIDIESSDLFQSVLPKNCTASLFVNREVYLVIANYNQAEINVVTNDKYVSVIDKGQKSEFNRNIKGRSMEILKLIS